MRFQLALLFIGIALIQVSVASSTKCDRDNVLRALQSCAGVASTFCQKLLATTTGTTHATLTAPSCVTQFPSSRLPSACSCLTDFPALSTSTGSSSSSTIKKTTLTSSTKVSSSSISSSSLKSSTSSIKFSTSSTKLSSSSKTTSSSSRSSAKSSTSSTKSSTSIKKTSSSSTSNTKSSTSSLKSSPSSITPSTTSSSSTTFSVFSTFSGISVAVTSAPSSCYSLPTPTASLTAIAYNDTLNSPLNSTIDMYVASDGTAPGYMGITVNGSYFIYDVSNPNLVAITTENGNSMVINNTGVYFFGANCGEAVAVSIPNFAGQIALANQSLGSFTKRDSQELVQRTTAAETDFTVDLQLTNQCGQPYTGQNPTVNSGPTPCDYQSSNNGDFKYTCHYPGALSTEATCETDVGFALSGIVVTGLFATSQWWPKVVATILPRNILALIASALGAELELGILIAGVVVLTILQKLLISLGVDAVTHKICFTLFGNQAMNVIMSLLGQQSLLETITAATPTSQALTVNDPNVPACCAGGSCGNYQACGSGGDCFCGSDVMGVSACVLNEYCDLLTPCGANSDCDAGWVCLAANCCGYSVCSDGTSCGVAPATLGLLRLDAEVYNTSGTVLSGGLKVGGVITRA